MDIQRKKYVSEFIKWVIDKKPDAFVTLTFRVDVTEEDASTALNRFLYHLNQDCLPKKQFRHGKKIVVFPFRERGVIGRLHYHLIMCVPPKYKNRVGAFKALIRKRWFRVEGRKGRPCGGDPNIHDKPGLKWFLYKEGGLGFSATEYVVRYCLKSLTVRDGNLKNSDCVDINNLSA